ncbi:uncharacterized protein [Halyomorpha halys]|uniref:uncharacterized protein isoform X2 n=1 Tax=Halyomorpha halys TaxID=286706 RepID=UPI0006D4EEB9
MSVLARETENIGKVFDDLCLSRRVMKRAEGTQTPPEKEVALPGEVPDECVSSLIAMLTPSLSKHYSNKRTSNSKDVSSESDPLLAEVEEISVDRTRAESKKVTIKKSNSTEMKEIFEELCLSRKKTSFTMTSEMSSSEAHSNEQDGEVPDEGVSSMIEMLRPSVRKLPKKNDVPARKEKPENNSETNEKQIRGYQSEPTVGPLSRTNVSTTLSEVSLDSIFTTPSNLTDTIDENLIKTLLSSQQQIDQQIVKALVETGSNTEFSRNSRRKSKKKRKRSNVIHIKDSATDAIYQTEDSINQTEDSINQTEDLSSKETEELLEDGIKSTTKLVEIKEQCNLSLEVEKKKSKEVKANNEITVLRNRTDWTDTPFLPQESNETVEEFASNIDSEPTRGKRPTEKKESEYRKERDSGLSNFFSRPITNTCTVSSPLSIARLDNKIQDRMFPSHSTLSTPQTSTGTSLTSLSCPSSYGEDKLKNCCCNTALTDTCSAVGEPKVLWAVTKINVYPDDSRTYEVMPLSGKKPSELPEKSECVFVLIPPKPGQFVPSNYE